MCGGVWNGFLLGKAKKEDFVVKGMVMVAYYGVFFSLLQHVRDFPEFATLMSLNRSNWPQCLLWHGWLPGLSGISDKVDFASCWTPPDYWDADDIALEMSEHPNTLTDGSREDFSPVAGV